MGTSEKKSCNVLNNSVKYFSTDATTSKAPVTPPVTPETQLGRYFPCSRITTFSTGVPKAQAEQRETALESRRQVSARGR